MIVLQRLLILSLFAIISATNTPDDGARQSAEAFRDMHMQIEIVRAGFCAICIPLCRMGEAAHAQSIVDEIGWYIDDDPVRFEINIEGYNRDQVAQEILIDDLKWHIDALVRFVPFCWPCCYRGSGQRVEFVTFVRRTTIGGWSILGAAISHLRIVL